MGGQDPRPFPICVPSSSRKGNLYVLVAGRIISPSPLIRPGFGRMHAWVTQATVVPDLPDPPDLGGMT